MCNTMLTLSKGFMRKLKGHLLNRLLERDFDGDDPQTFTEDELSSVQIANNQVYSVKTLSVNYTTYDVRRDRDTINPRNHNFVMVRSSEDGPGLHPYWYAQVLGVYHAFVSTTHPATRYRSAQQMGFLWVRWLGVEPRYRSGSQYARLPMVGFVEDSDELAFGFLDPSLVIRGSHLIPRFASGQTSALMPYQGPTAARIPGCTEDWINFYVDMYVIISTIQGFTELIKLPSFVDRDMFMRYYGGGIGHGDTAADAEVSVDPAEVVYESSEARLEFQDMDDDDDDDDDDDEADDPGESTDEETANVC